MCKISDIIKSSMKDILKSIEKNEVYYNEKQFQFDLANKLNKKLSKEKCEMFFEVKTSLKDLAEDSKKAFIDLVVYDNKDKSYYAIELKYKKKNATYGNIELPYDGAQDNGRYDFLKDLQRVEEIFNKEDKCIINHRNREFKKCIGGCAIILTNDNSYWDIEAGNYNYNNLTIGENEKISKTTTYKWRNNIKVAKCRKEVIKFKNDYNIEWSKCSNNGAPFRYLIIEAQQNFIKKEG